MINWLKKNQSVSGVSYYISSSCYVLNNLKIKVMYWHFKLRRFWLIVHFLHRINAGQLVVFESYSGKSYRGDCGCSAGYNQNYWPKDGKCYEWYSQVQWYKNLCWLSMVHQSNVSFFKQSVQSTSRVTKLSNEGKGLVIFSPA